MVNMDKEKQRAEVHKTIWAIANKLRGSVDGWDFKQYVLGMLFYRYISENICNYINENEHKVGNIDFSYASLADEIISSETKNDLIKEKGFFIYPSELFENVCKRKQDKDNINEILETIFSNIENSSKMANNKNNFAGLFKDINLNSDKIGASSVIKRNEIIFDLLNSVAEMQLGRFEDNTIDAFGDAYEFLMGMYASEAGKSGGEYYTPQEVSELLAHIAIANKTKINKVYDPAAGSGALLLKFQKILGKENITNGFFGQEINHTTYNLCRMNMFLHNIDYDKFSIGLGDTLTEPQHWDDEPFEAIVSNPPYSIRWEGDDNSLLINDKRFSPAGVLAPKSKADFAFVLHVLSWLAADGVGAIICFPGLMYRGGSEQKIRQYLVDNNFIDTIIQLPPNLFYGTTIATCILVLKKAKAQNGIFFIDASKEFDKVGIKNKLTSTNITNILNCYNNNDEIENYSKFVSYDELVAKNYDLSVKKYILQKEAAEINISEVNNAIAAIVENQDQLKAQIKDFIDELNDEII